MLLYAIILCTGRIYFPYLSHPFWFWGPSNILSCGLQGLFLQGYTGQRMKPATYFHLVLRLEKHSPLSLFVEQFLVHIFLHCNFNYWKSSYICVEGFIMAFQAKAEQLLLDCNLAFYNLSSTIQQIQNIRHLLSIM